MATSGHLLDIATVAMPCSLQFDAQKGNKSCLFQNAINFAWDKNPPLF
jgi:hypothetical protein